MSDPIALGVLLIALLGVLLAVLAIAWRWFTRHRSTLYRAADAIRQRVARLGLVARLRHRFPRTKAIFQRPRPEEAGQIVHGHSWSFPSGHAMGSVVTFGMLAYLISLFGGANAPV